MSKDTTDYTFLEPWRGCLSDEQIEAGYAATHEHFQAQQDRGNYARCVNPGQQQSTDQTADADSQPPGDGWGWGQ